MINRFRREVYLSFAQRADAGLDLIAFGGLQAIDALTSTLHVEPPVATSESPLFQHGFSSIYDMLNLGQIHFTQLRQVSDKHQPADAEQIAGYEV